MSSEHLDVWARLSQWARPERSAEWIARRNLRMALAIGLNNAPKPVLDNISSLRLIDAVRELQAVSYVSRWYYRLRYYTLGWYGGKKG